jgi:hypothetical protein
VDSVVPTVGGWLCSSEGGIKITARVETDFMRIVMTSSFRLIISALCWASASVNKACIASSYRQFCSCYFANASIKEVYIAAIIYWISDSGNIVKIG